jgi:transcriptional antiterminator NusG
VLCNFEEKLVMSWFALFVNTGKEEAVQERIRFYFDEAIVSSLIPKRRLMERKGGMVKSVLKKMFPGYVFICVDICVDIYYRLKNIPYIIRILNTGEYFTEISEKEMFWILELLDDDGIVDYSKVYLKDSEIVVESGPLKGNEGLIVAIDKRRSKVKIRLDLMGRIKEFYIGIKLLPFRLR